LTFTEYCPRYSYLYFFRKSRSLYFKCI